MGIQEGSILFRETWCNSFFQKKAFLLPIFMTHNWIFKEYDTKQWHNIHRRCHIFYYASVAFGFGPVDYTRTLIILPNLPFSYFLHFCQKIALSQKLFGKKYIQTLPKLFRNSVFDYYTFLFCSHQSDLYLSSFLSLSEITSRDKNLELFL